MKTRLYILVAGLFLATIGAAIGQPTIITQPTNWPPVSLGANLTNRVVAAPSGPGQLLYQWRLNGAYLADQTNPSITVDRVGAGG